MRLIEVAPGVYVVYARYRGQEWFLTVASLNDDRLFSERFGANLRAELSSPHDQTV